MKRLFLLPFLLLLLAPAASAQETVYWVRSVDSAPTVCSLNRLYIVKSTGAMYANVLGACAVVGSGEGGGTGDMVLASVQTVTGTKSFATGKLVVLGSTSGSTVLNASAIASGTITFPAATDTVAVLAAAQTIGNKTLSNTNTATFQDNGFVFQDNLDNTKQATFQFSGLSSATTRTFSWPDATTTLLGHDTTATVSNKSLALGSNTVTGTIAQFNTALTDGDFATLAGTESLSNKTFVTPVLGVASATSINKVAITAPATSATLTIADGKTLTASNTLTFTGTDASSVAFGAGGTVVYTGSNLGVFAATTSAQLAGVVSNETGSSAGLLVFNDSPTIVTPTIASFVNATHTHQSAAGGGSLDGAAIGSGTVLAARLPATTVYTGQANTFGAFLQDFSAGTLKVPSSAGYAPTTAGLCGYNSTSNRFVCGNGTVTHIFLTDSSTDTLTNKSLDAATNTISNLGTSNIASASKTGNGTKIATANIVVPASNKCLEMDSAGNIVKAGTDAPCGASGGGGDVTTTGDQTISGAKTFTDGKLILAGSTSGTTTLKANTTAGTTTISFPAATDTVVLNDASATLTNKSVSLGSNTVTSTLAQLNTAVTDADVASIAGTETLTNKTLTAPKLGSAGYIADANGNEVIKTAATVASAVNEITVTNAATGGSPTISATGGDTDIDLTLSGKGAGVVKVASLTTTGTDAGAVDFEEADANGSSYVTVTAPSSLSANFTQTLMAATGTVALTTGAVATDDCAKFDSSGRLVSAGAACGSGGGGSGTVSAGTTNAFAIYTASTTVDDSARLTETGGNTLAYSGSGGISSTGAGNGTLTLTGSGVGVLSMSEGTVPSGTASSMVIAADSTTHRAQLSNNAGSFSNILTAASTDTVTNKSISGSTNTLTAIPLSTAVTGVLPAANGGAGTVSGVLKANGSGTVSQATAGTDYLTPGATQTVTATRITKRVTSIVSNATWSPNADTDDVFKVTAQAVAATTINNPSGTPTEGQMLLMRIKDDGTGRALTWSGSKWRFSTDLAAPSTTTAGKTLYLGFVYNLTDDRWDMVAKLDNF